MLVRMHHIEQKLDIPSALPQALEPLRDPFELYDEACKEFFCDSSDQPRRHGKQQAGAKDEEYIEDDDDGGDHDDDDEGYEDEQSFLSRDLPLLALVDKGGVLGFDLSM